MIRPLPLNHVLAVRDMNRGLLDDLFVQARAYAESGHADRVAGKGQGKIVATLFFQPSTRTRLSFESAAARLGSKCLACADGATMRAGSAWHESLSDTAKVVSSYADLVVIRHGSPDAAREYANSSSIPVVNAGDGTEHPTQAMVDLLTLKTELGRLDGLSVMVAGDLTQRCVRSFVLGLSMYQAARIILVAHPGKDLDSASKAKAISSGATVLQMERIAEGVDQVDAIYMAGMNDPADAPLPAHQLDAQMLGSCAVPPVVLHPLPRGIELPKSLDDLPNSAYFRQSANAVSLRMALILSLLR